MLGEIHCSFLSSCILFSSSTFSSISKMKSPCVCWCFVSNNTQTDNKFYLLSSQTRSWKYMLTIVRRSGELLNKLRSDPLIPLWELLFREKKMRTMSWTGNENVRKVVRANYALEIPKYSENSLPYRCWRRLLRLVSKLQMTLRKVGQTI